MVRCFHMEKEIIIQTEHLTKRYKGKAVVDDLSINVYKGDIYGFVGRNGAGKTTLIRMLVGLVKPSSGTYSLFGSSSKRDLQLCQRDIAAMVETPSLYYDMTAEDNLKARCILLNKDFSLVEPRLIEVGLKDVISSKKKVNNFSLGMKQRLAIAMAILGNPRLLILDEPTNGLDPEGIKDVRELLVDLNKKHGITIFISSHILSELSKFATTYGFIDHGKIIKEISAEELDRTSKKGLTIRFSSSEDIEKAKDILNDEFSQFEYEQTSNTLHIFGVEDIAIIIGKFYSEGLKISFIKEQENGLEDFFLSLTKGDE